MRGSGHHLGTTNLLKISMWRTWRYRNRSLNITDEELRKAMTGVWERRRQLKAVGQSG
jgi:hypothetical protein